MDVYSDLLKITIIHVHVDYYKMYNYMYALNNTDTVEPQ